MKSRHSNLLMLIILMIYPFSLNAQSDVKFYLAENGVTIMCPDAAVGETGQVGGVTYEAVDRALLIQRRDEGADLTRVCTSLVMDMGRMFEDKSDFNQPIGNWDVSNVGSMYHMFVRARSFNQPIGNWDVSSVTTMGWMFHAAESFNQPIGDWNVSRLSGHHSISGTFEYARSFNQDISRWDVSKIQSMWVTFNGATSFNQPLSSWNVSNVTNMRWMFRNAVSFNQDISSWNVGSVREMEQMFEGAASFNQNLGEWRLSSLTNNDGGLLSALSSSGMSVDNYNQTLIGWAEGEQAPNNINMGADGLIYSAEGAVARQKLIDEYSWTITGDTKSSSVPFITVWKTNNSGWSTDTQVYLPITGPEYEIDWEEVDNASNSGSAIGSGHHLLEFPSAGTYRISVTGGFSRMHFEWNNHDAQKLLSTEQWGDANWSTMNAMFRNASNVQFNAEDVPDLTNVRDMGGMFLSAWNFNSDISGWNVSSVTSMNSMFQNAQNFNRDLSGWDVSSVTNMGWMFYYASNFNQDISSWNVGSVRGMQLMFERAASFNQNLGGWNLSSLTNNSGGLSNAFNGSGMSVDKYNQTLIGWSEGGKIPNNIALGAIGLIYSADGVAARQKLIDEFGWQITGDATASTVPFITVWKTDNPGYSQNNQIYLPISGPEYQIDWEEVGNASNSGSVTGGGHYLLELPSAGTYRVSLSGAFSRMHFEGNNHDAKKLLSVEQWGDANWSTMNAMFRNASNVQFNAEDVPDLTNVRDMSQMIVYAYNFNSDISGWDVSSVTNMSFMFGYATSFNGDLSGWDVSSVTNMGNMFFGASNFNGDLSGWDVSSVTNMGNMFGYATSFNGDLSGWDVSSVTNMGQMFNNAQYFNGDVSNWDVSSVTNMSDMFINVKNLNGDLSRWDVSSVTSMGRMFANAVNFNGDISGWDVSLVKSMESMFWGAHNFNGDLSRWDVSSVINMGQMFLNAGNFKGDISGWNVSSVTNMLGMFANAVNFNGDISSWNVGSVRGMQKMFEGAASFNQNLGGWNLSSMTNNSGGLKDAFNGSGISTTNYDLTLTGWVEGGKVANNITLGANGLVYSSAGTTARQKLIDDYGWSISGDNSDPSYDKETLFSTNWQRALTSSNLPDWFGADTERGMAYGNGSVYVASRNAGVNVRFVNATDGTDAGHLNVTGVEGGIFPLNAVDVSDDGVIFAANMTLNASTAPFKFYHWSNNDVAPVAVTTTVPDAVRLGDKFAVTGRVANGTAQVWAASATTGNARVYIWTMNGGVFNTTPVLISLTDNVTGGGAAVEPLPDGSFWMAYNGSLVKKYNADGTLAGTVPETIIATASNSISHIGYDENGDELIAVFTYGVGNENAKVFKVPGGIIENAVQIGTTPALRQASNGNGAGDVSVRVNDDLSYTIFVLGTNNGIGAYTTVVGSIIERVESQLVSFDHPITAGWNLVGLPADTESSSYTGLFPSARSNTLYGFSGNYVEYAELTAGLGYWIYNEEESQVPITGRMISEVTISLNEGWNLVAGPSVTVPLLAAADDENLIVPGTLYSYAGSYQASDSLRPGYGYWLLTTGEGQVTFGEAFDPESILARARPDIMAALQSFTSITLRSADNHQATVYFDGSLPDPSDRIRFSMPPLSPGNGFDVRTEDGFRLAEESTVRLEVQSQALPLVLKIETSSTDDAAADSGVDGVRSAASSNQAASAVLYRVEQWDNDHLLETLMLAAGQKLQLEATTNGLVITRLSDNPDALPTEFALNQNFPNPFNPSTTIRYALPEAAQVRLEVFTVTGQRVAVLASGEQNAGWHTVAFDGSSLASGVYIYRLQAGGFVQTRKLMLIK
jgi:surface protein